MWIFVLRLTPSTTTHTDAIQQGTIDSFLTATEKMMVPVVIMPFSSFVPLS